jgi:hypothetical protein
MVHALDEIRRVLLADGIMIDLRPLQDRWHIEVTSGREVRETGRVQDYPSLLADDEAANRAMARAAANGWFTREQEEVFPYYYSWDTPSEMEEWVETEWQDFLTLSEDARRATRSVWSLADADARVQIRAKMLITRWRVTKDA